MFIIPLIDIYASGLDWFLAGVPPPRGLLFFFAVSYMNGIVLEIGRNKPRSPKFLNLNTGDLCTPSTRHIDVAPPARQQALAPR